MEHLYYSIVVKKNNQILEGAGNNQLPELNFKLKRGLPINEKDFLRGFCTLEMLFPIFKMWYSAI